MREMVLYGTLGGSCRERETMEALFRAGMTGARLNLSHAPLDAFAPLLADFWTAARETGVRRESAKDAKDGTDAKDAKDGAGAKGAKDGAGAKDAKGGTGGADATGGAADRRPRLVIDLQGPELRIGRLDAPVPLVQGGTAVLVPEAAYPWEMTDTLEGAAVPVPETVLEVLRAGDRVSLDDSAILLEAGEAGRDRAVCRVLRGGTLPSRKSLAVLGKTVPQPALTAEDLRNLSLAGRFGVTDILQPFVRGREDVEALRSALDREGLSQVRIMAKIENSQGLDKLEEIAAAADEICVARGDLGNGLPLWEVPRYQKRIAAVCRALGTPFCVATQLLWSMQTRSVPTRAEMCDIYNAVLDGAAGLMLTGETAAGQYPAEAMAYLARAARTACEDRA